MNKYIVSVSLKGIALALGVAVIVLSTLGTLIPNNGVNLLAIGMAALALAALQKG
jgi:hypothetical protein